MMTICHHVAKVQPFYFLSSSSAFRDFRVAGVSLVTQYCRGLSAKTFSCDLTVILSNMQYNYISVFY